MANKTYYEQNYPTTKYEYNSRGYRNERAHCNENRPVPINDPSPPNVGYSYYPIDPDESYERNGEEQWEYQDYNCDKQNPMHLSKKKSCNQLTVNTPRYYKNMAHKQPSALSIPLLVQTEPRRKSKSQNKFETSEKCEKTPRYRVKQNRHHIMPPPPPTFPQPTTHNENTDIETSSADGRHSFLSHTHSSGSLSVDISSQVETLNQSFDAATRERKGRKIIYHEVQPIYSNMDTTPVKHRKSRRHKKNGQLNDTTENWGNQLWDLPEDVQGEAVWTEQQTNWNNGEPQYISSSMPNTGQCQKKSHSKKHHHYNHSHYRQQPTSQSQMHQICNQLQVPLQPSQELHVTSQHMLPAHQMSQVFSPQLMQQQQQQQQLHSHKQLQIQQQNQFQNQPPHSVPGKFVEPRPTSRSNDTQMNQEEEKGISYLENLFSEVFAQGRFDNLSKKTRLDFLKDAYNKYSSLEDTDAQNGNDVTNAPDLENTSSNEFPQQGNTCNKNMHNQNTESNNFENHNSSNSMKDKKHINITNFKDDCTRTIPSKGSQNTGGQSNNSFTQNAVPNFFLNVKPRRSMKLDDNKQDIDSMPRYPHLIEHLSPGYLSSSNAERKDSLQTSDNSELSRNQNVPSQSPAANCLQNQNIKDFEHNQLQKDSFNVSHLQKGVEVQNQHNSNERASLNRLSFNANQEPHYSQGMGHQNPITTNYMNAGDNYVCNKYHHKQDENNYSNEDNADYSNLRDQYHEQCNYNCSISDEMNKLTINNGYENNEDYSSNMENNYITIRKCREVLNQVRENFGECLKENPDVFTDGNDQFDAVNATQGILHGKSMYDDESYNMINQQMHKQQNETTFTENERVAPANNYCCEYQESNFVDNSIEGQLHNRRRSLCEKSKNQDVQTDLNCKEKIVQNYINYENNNPSQNEGVSNNNEASSCSNIDQERVKQFIHSLTGFDVTKKHKAQTIETQGTEYEGTNLKFQSDPDYSQNVCSNPNLLSVSDNTLSSEHHHSRFYHGHQRSKSKVVDKNNADKHKHYLMPQRHEIERIRQEDSHNSSFDRGKQEAQINQYDFPHEVPNRTNTSQEYKHSGLNELGKVEYTKLHHVHNSSTDVGQMSIGDQPYYYSQCDNHNENYNMYEYDYNKLPEDQSENMNYNPEQTSYFANASYNPHPVGHQSSQEYHSPQRVMVNQEQEAFHNSTDNTNKQYSSNLNSHEMFDCRLNYVDNGDFPEHNLEENYEHSEDNCEDTKTEVMKRKYCYMSDVNYHGNMKNVDVTDESGYKSYIENIIDSSMQNSNSSLTRIPQNINQGPVMQSQNDVVELETDKAIDLVMNESACQMDSKLCLEITQRLTDTLVQSDKDIPTPCLVALEEPVYLQQLKKLRWDHLRHIEREVKRLESLERFLDTCGCGHMMYTKNAG